MHLKRYIDRTESLRIRSNFDWIRFVGFTFKLLISFNLINFYYLLLYLEEKFEASFEA